VCLVLVALAVPAVGTATAQSSNEKPKATEVGVTDTEIHIGVVADVDTRSHRACSRVRSTA